MSLLKITVSIIKGGGGREQDIERQRWPPYATLRDVTISRYRDLEIAEDSRESGVLNSVAVRVEPPGSSCSEASSLLGVVFLEALCPGITGVLPRC